MTAVSGAVRELGGEVWHVAASLEDLPAGTHRVVDVAGRSIGLFNIAGKLYAVRNICPHQAGPVCGSKRTTGTLVARPDTEWRPEWAYEGEIIACPWHGLEYHVPTGRCLANARYRLRGYRVRIEANEVLLSLQGSPERGEMS